MPAYYIIKRFILGYLFYAVIHIARISLHKFLVIVLVLL